MKKDHRIEPTLPRRPFAIQPLIETRIQPHSQYDGPSILVKNILIKVDDLEFEATLNQSKSSAALWDALPIKGAANRWGDEIYFSVPIEAELEPNATDTLPAGSLAYWPPGNAFCIIWGPTPASHSDEPRFASPVNALGSITGDWSKLSSIHSGTSIIITKPSPQA